MQALQRQDGRTTMDAGPTLRRSSPNDFACGRFWAGRRRFSPWRRCSRPLVSIAECTIICSGCSGCRTQSNETTSGDNGDHVEVFSTNQCGLHRGSPAVEDLGALASRAGAGGSSNPGGTVDFNGAGSGSLRLRAFLPNLDGGTDNTGAGVVITASAVSIRRSGWRTACIREKHEHERAEAGCMHTGLVGRL